MKKLFLSTMLLAGVLVLGACGQGSEGGSETNDGILVISREQGSGTRGAFDELLDINQDDSNMMTSGARIGDGNGNVATSVVSNPAAIGYVSFATMNGNDKLRGLLINGIEPTYENVLNRTFPIAREFNMIYNEEFLTDLEYAFLEFAASVHGLEVLADAGTIVDPTGAVDFDHTKWRGLSGSLSLGGSTSVERAATALATQFRAYFPSVSFDYQSAGSGAGIRNAQDGTFSIGFASREVLASELSAGVVSRRLAMDGIAIVVHKSNPVTGIAFEQLRDIYLGEISNWGDLN
jgi:phosphate transport system substrate-binding protein